MSAFPWKSITHYTTCSMELLKSFSCFVEFRDVKIPNPGQRMIVIVEMDSHGDTSTSVAAFVEVVQMGVFGNAKEWLALVVLTIALICLAAEMAHRMWIAFIGSMFMTGACEVRVVEVKGWLRE